MAAPGNGVLAATSLNPPLVTPYTNVPQVSFDFWAKPVLIDSNGAYYCPGFEGLTYQNNLDSVVTIGGGSSPSAFAGQNFQLPGLCTVHCTKEYAIDKKKPAGSNGARVTIHGIDAADIEIEVMIWTPEQLRQLRNIWAVIFPGNKGSQQARDVSHPTFTQHGVKSMIVTRGRGPDRGPVVNSRIFTISGIEFIKPAGSVTFTPVGATPLNTTLGPAYSTPGSNGGAQVP